MLLLIGDRDDPHLQKLHENLRKEVECYILSTLYEDLLNTEFSFYSDISNQFSCSIRQNHQKIELSEVLSAFCLTPIFRLQGDNRETTQEFRFWYFSWKEALFGAYSILASENKFVNSSVYNCLKCQSKILTFLAAKKVGLETADSYIGNSKKTIFEFLEANNPAALKTLHQMNLQHEGEPTMLLTQRVNLEDFSDYQQSHESPLFLQKYIDKVYDLRLVIIGQKVMSCKIDATQSSIGRVDYRAYDLPNTPHTEVQISAKLQNQVKQLCQILQLEYACLDFCVDSFGRHWLLDVNPFGRYLWMEYATGMLISDNLSKFLLNRKDVKQK